MSDDQHFLRMIDQARQAAGFLTVAETLVQAAKGNIIVDPYSTLIAPGVALGQRNIFYPHTRLARSHDAVLEIGSGNVFYSNSVIEAAETNTITIGDGNEFGERARLRES